MLHCIIVDDDKKLVEQLKICLSKRYHEDMVIDEAYSLLQLDKKRNHKEYDLYLIDIEVGKENGVYYGNKR